MIKLNKCIKHQVLDIIKTKEKKKEELMLILVWRGCLHQEDVLVPAQAKEGPAGAISSPERVGKKSGDWWQLDKIKE
jgi:hypothetical protein